MIKSQKNTILELITQANIEPFLFEWNQIKSSDNGGFSTKQVSILNFISSAYYFIFDFKNEHHHASYSPGDDREKEENTSITWEGQLKTFKYWLNLLKREITQPDLWENLAERHNLFKPDLNPETTNEPFTDFQSEKIIMGIENTRTYLLDEFKDIFEADKLINNKLNYLIENAKKQGKKDWFYTCIGVFVSISMALAMSPDQASHLWKLFKNVVAGMLKLLPG